MKNIRIRRKKLLDSAFILTPVKFFLDFKLRSAIESIGNDLEYGQMLVICCGSGMDANFLPGGNAGSGK